MNYNDFAARLGNLEDSRLPHVFLLCGEETYFTDKAAKLLVDRLLPSARERADGLVQLEGANDPQTLEQEISAVPFFGDRLVVLVKQSKIFGDKRKPGREDEGEGRDKKPSRSDKAMESLAAIADMPETNYVIFRQNAVPDKRKKVYKVLEKAGMVMEAAPLRPWQAADWLAADLSHRGFRLEPAAYEYLTGMLSALHEVPLGYLSGELDKLELFLAAQGIRPGAGRGLTIISTEQVKASFSKLPEISGFAIMTAIDEGRGADALRLFAEELKGGSYLPVIAGMLVRRVREYLTAKALLKRGLRGRELSQALGQQKFYPNIINQLIRTVNNKEESLLRRVFLDLAEADYRLKTGKGGPELLEAAIIALAKG